jgi:hypothetical protein
MKKLRSLLQQRIVWTTARALLAFIAVAMIADFLLRALGFVQGASPHTWLLDVQQNLGSDGAAGALGSTGACGANDGADDPPDNILDSLRNGKWPFGDPGDPSSPNYSGPRLESAPPWMRNTPIQSTPSDGAPVFTGFSGSVGDRLEQFFDFLNAAKTYATGRGEGETEGTAAPPEEVE